MADRTAVEETAAFTIQDVSRRSGLSEPTLRYYERIGLIAPVLRDVSSRHRRYDEQTVQRIESIACMRASGIGIEDMRESLRLLGQGRSAAVQQRELFEKHVARLEAEMTALRLRQRYVQAKADLWASRERGDEDGERRAFAEIMSVVDEWRSA